MRDMHNGVVEPVAVEDGAALALHPDAARLAALPSRGVAGVAQNPRGHTSLPFYRGRLARPESPPRCAWRGRSAMLPQRRSGLPRRSRRRLRWHRPALSPGRSRSAIPMRRSWSDCPSAARSFRRGCRQSRRGPAGSFHFVFRGHGNFIPSTAARTALCGLVKTGFASGPMPRP
jgi:hypothetical protein